MHTNQPRRHYGWRPDRPDQRDYQFAPMVMRVPAAVDLEHYCPPVMDQGQLGSCTAHGCTAAFRYDLIARGKHDVPLSRLMAYYGARALEGTTQVDAGAEIRDAIKTIVNQGTCAESMWPYTVSTFRKKPTPACYTAGKAHEVLTYQRVTQSLSAIKAALAGGLPVVIGIAVYESFEGDNVAANGVVPMPGRHEATVGGHCMLVIGYSDVSQQFKTRNSWGTGWGSKGNCFLPYAYLTNPNLCSDLWVVSSVTG